MSKLRTRGRNEMTMIDVRVSTREMLREIGRKGESYDDIIRRLLQK